MNRLTEIPELVKESLDMASNIAINAVNNVSARQFELGA